MWIRNCHKKAHVEYKNNPSFRLGQCIFNEVYLLLDLCDFINKNIIGTNKDCFYNDAYIDDFIKAVKNEVLLRIFTDADEFWNRK